MKKRIPAVLTAAVLCVAMLASFSSCGSGRQSPIEKAIEEQKHTIESTEERTEATSADTAAPESETFRDTETEEPYRDDGFAGIDGYVSSLALGVDSDGYTFTVIGRDSDNFPTTYGETGDITNDAVYYRQSDLSRIFGVEWESVLTDSGSDTADRVANEVMAGGAGYDLIYGNVVTVCQPLLYSGSISRVDDLDPIDLDREWWVGSLRDCYSIGGKLFFLRGDAVVERFLDTDCVLVNKSVASMFDIDCTDLYDLAREGRWTLDEMLRIAGKIPANPSGKGVYRYANANATGLLFSTGLSVTSFDGDGAPYVETSVPFGISDLSEITVGMFADNSLTPNWDYTKGESKEEKYGVDPDYDWFIDDRALFSFSDTGTARYYRSYDVDFGILPMPKGSESQTEYRSYAYPFASAALMIPRVTGNEEIAATVTEAMGALSSKYVKTAYYDEILRGRSVFDIESRDMLDIIFGSAVYDLIDLYDGEDISGWGPLMNCLYHGMTFDNSSIVSDWKANARVANTMAKQLVREVERND